MQGSAKQCKAARRVRRGEGTRLVQEASNRFAIGKSRMAVDQDQALLAMKQPHVGGQVDLLLAKEVEDICVVTVEVKESAHVVGEQVACRFAI